MDEQWSQHKHDIAILINSITSIKNDVDAAKAIQNINKCLDQCYKLLENNADAGGPMVEENYASTGPDPNNIYMEQTWYYILFYILP